MWLARLRGDSEGMGSSLVIDETRAQPRTVAAGLADGSLLSARKKKPPSSRRYAWVYLKRFKPNQQDRIALPGLPDAPGHARAAGGAGVA